MDIVGAANRVDSKAGFIDFLGALIDDFNENSNEWENDSLEKFFQAMNGYLIDSRLENKGAMSWCDLAKLLVATSVYE